MKKLALIAIVALGMAAATPLMAADALEGMWLTTKDDNDNSGLIQVSACGGKLCGVLIKAYGPSGAEVASENIGRQLIWDTVNKGGGVYRGKVYSPDRDTTYKSKLVLTDGNRLSVSGCRFGICREGGVWHKQ